MENKRDKVLNELSGLADALGINIDYVIDKENRREYLVCDDTKISTYCNSIDAIREELIGYAFLWEWRNRFLEDSVIYIIKKYWYDDDFNQPYFYYDNEKKDDEEGCKKC